MAAATEVRQFTHPDSDEETGLPSPSASLRLMTNDAISAHPLSLCDAVSCRRLAHRQVIASAVWLLPPSYPLACRECHVHEH